MGLHVCSSKVPSPIPTLGNDAKNLMEPSSGTTATQLKPAIPPVTTSDLVRDTSQSSSPGLTSPPSTSLPLGPSPPPDSVKYSDKDSDPDIAPPPNPGKVIDSQITTDSSSLTTNTIISVTSANSETVSISTISTSPSLIPATVTAPDLTTATASGSAAVEDSGPPTVTKSAQSPDLSPGKAQTPVLDPFVSASPASSTGVSTSTTTTTTTARTSDTPTIMSTPKEPVTSTVQVSSISPQDPILTSSIKEHKGSPTPDGNISQSSITHATNKTKIPRAYKPSKKSFNYFFTYR
ncbi:hypothetical protein POVWA1_066580 [Plasmodium ovale wallikeri]|uniref:Uncharacterized protein n=1 Tax=Plasmodium ovale wallikeri TaxID=864142 RepID=A0A1A9AEJ0_PLAOA|nr:hypothetical protein POVWA1_066580 [Plasmodium ovale wallikeri]